PRTRSRGAAGTCRARRACSHSTVVTARVGWDRPPRAGTRSASVPPSSSSPGATTRPTVSTENACPGSTETSPGPAGSATGVSSHGPAATARPPTTPCRAVLRGVGTTRPSLVSLGPSCQPRQQVLSRGAEPRLHPAPVDGRSRSGLAAQGDGLVVGGGQRADPGPGRVPDPDLGDPRRHGRAALGADLVGGIDLHAHAVGALGRERALHRTVVLGGKRVEAPHGTRDAGVDGDHTTGG